MIRSLILAAAAVTMLTGCEGRRALDNPENLDNMPVEADRVEDTTDLHKTATVESDDATTKADGATPRSGQL